MLNPLQRIMMGLPGTPFGIQEENQNSPSPPASGGGAGAAAGGSFLPAVAAPMIDQDSQTALYDKMGQMGALLLATGQRMTPEMRGQILSQGVNVMGNTPNSRLNSAQARLMNAKALEAQQIQAQRDAFQKKIAADPSILNKLGVTQEHYDVMGPEAVTKALEAQLSRDPTDVAYKKAMIEHLKNGNVNDWQPVGEDEFGTKQYGVPSQIMQQRQGQPQPNIASNPNTIFSQLGNATGPEALTKLQEINPAIAAEVGAIVRGDQPFPPRMFGTKHGAMLNALVSQVDPSYNAGTYKQRQDTIKDFNKNGGANSSGGQASFGETGIKHMKEIYDLSNNLPNHTNFGPLNSTVNSLDAAMQKKSANGGNVGAYNLAVINGMDEIAKALGIGGEGGRAELQHQLEAAQGPDAIKQVVRQQAKLLKEKLETLQSRWNSQMGPAAGNKKIIGPEAEQFLNHILGEEPKNNSEAPRTTNINGVTIRRIN